MKNLFKNALIEVNKHRYLSLLIILAPLLNFLSGITFDLHAPSLPAIASYYAAPISAAKNTITVSLLGFSIGCILFGTLLDIFGRRPVILSGLLLYTIASFSALACGTIDELLLVRFMQGFAVSCLSIGCRAIVIDNFTGHQFKVALLYTSIAFGIGPIIAPFVGGYIQYHFGWQANFITYGVVALVLMSIFIVYIAESKKGTGEFSFKKVSTSYLGVFRHVAFPPGMAIAGLGQMQLLVYTTTGAFLVENILHRSAIVYGNSALVISCGYLLGTLVNRFLIKNFRVHHLINLGFVLMFLGILLQILFSLFGQLNLLTIILPFTLIGFSNGFIFINVFTCCLSLSGSQAGVATAAFTAVVMVIGTIGTYVVSHINVGSLAYLAAIFGITAVLQLIIFYMFFKDVAKEAA